jgi:DNA-binding MarR family transcriptional regulator
VLKQLIDADFIEQRPGPTDRRQRLLFPSDRGCALAERLLELQSRRIRAALQAMPNDLRPGAQAFLRAMIDPAERERVTRLISR